MRRQTLAIRKGRILAMLFGMLLVAWYERLIAQESKFSVGISAGLSHFPLSDMKGASKPIFPRTP
jgi:hypothetical protein